MPALDQCHEQIVRAFQKDGWQVNPKPAQLSIDDRTVYIDLIATKRSNGRKQQILLAEVKCFSDQQPSTTELYKAIGQYLVYRTMLELLQSKIPLYLAIPQHIFDDLFDIVLKTIVEAQHIKFVLVDLQIEEITKWIE